ncbi:DUF4224 domain-containing protein [Paraburkholderia tropica]|nr:DUF4224 domain-containing protein [Paraburkholderia tropica]MBB2983630.1 hypothetical protein [Paraburkholderia tropica]
MSDYLTTTELADLIGCKPNQRTRMINWLADNRCKFAVDRNGIPNFARAFCDLNLGLSIDTNATKYDREDSQADSANRKMLYKHTVNKT